jgi:hypothetical protein
VAEWPFEFYLLQAKTATALPALSNQTYFFLCAVGDIRRNIDWD